MHRHDDNPVTVTSRTLRVWIDRDFSDLGGCTRAAEAFGCSAGHVSKLKRGIAGDYTRVAMHYGYVAVPGAPYWRRREAVAA